MCELYSTSNQIKFIRHKKVHNTSVHKNTFHLAGQTVGVSINRTILKRS